MARVSYFVLNSFVHFCYIFPFGDGESAFLWCDCVFIYCLDRMKGSNI